MMGLEGAVVCCAAGVASVGAGVPAAGVCAGEKPAARAQQERSVRLRIVLMEMGKVILRAPLLCMNLLENKTCVSNKKNECKSYGGFT
jgi:hypothetical protein